MKLPEPFEMILISSFHALTNFVGLTDKTVIAFSNILDIAPLLFSTFKVTK